MRLTLRGQALPEVASAPESAVTDRSVQMSRNVKKREAS